MYVSKCEISIAQKQTETPFETESSQLKMLIYVSGQEGAIYQLRAFPASVHSSTSSQHRADLIFTDCQQPPGASCFSSWRPARSKVALATSPCADGRGRRCTNYCSNSSKIPEMGQKTSSCQPLQF